jgi:[ribosomal protein S18]-alanine N-acetyltransferase
MNVPAEPIHLRDGTRADLPALLALEAGFPGDRLTPRQFRHHLRNANARLRLAADGAGRTVGYAMLLRRRGSAAARLYSLVVDAASRGRGIAGLLLDDAEAIALAAGTAEIRLEVRSDNAAARSLYRRSGYLDVDMRRGYYEDGADALRLCKRLVMTDAT